MKTYAKLMIGIGLLLLAGNAAAISIAGKSDSGPVVVDMSLQDIAELLQSYQPESKNEKKYVKKAKKFHSKVSKVQSKLDSSTDDNKTAKLKRKILKKEKKLTDILRQMNLDLSAYLGSEISPAVTDIGNIPGEGATGDQSGDETRNVPEPSVFALLAIGLIGIGATRYRRQLT